MFRKFIENIRALPAPSRTTWLWALIILGIVTWGKGSFLLYLHSCSPSAETGICWRKTGDAESYLQPMEHWVTEGTYYWINSVGDTIRAGRAPYYAMPYGLARGAGASENMARTIQGALQWLLAPIALWFGLLLAYRLSGERPLVFYLGLLLLLGEFRLSHTMSFLQTEGMAPQLLLLGLYTLWRYRSASHWSWLLLSGFLLGYLVLLRAFLVLVPLTAAAYIAFHSWRRAPQGLQLPHTVGHLSLLALVPSLLLLPWIVRNYEIFDRFVPLQQNSTAGYAYTEVEVAYRNFMKAWGGSVVNWDHTTAGCYFEPNQRQPCHYTRKDLPSAMLQAVGMSRQEMHRLRNDYVALQRSPDSAARRGLDTTLINTFERLENRVYNRAPLYAWSLVPIKVTGQMVLHSGSYFMPIKPSSSCYGIWQLAPKVIQSGVYYFSLLFGGAGMVLLVAQRRGEGLGWVLLAVPVSIILVICVVFRGMNYHYFDPYMVLMALAAAYAVTVAAAKLGLATPGREEQNPGKN